MAAAKPHMNIVTIGHVDQGKSTLIGRLMFDTGNIPEQVMKKIEEKAKELKKESFKFAYVMDSTKEEQERGVTIDIAHKRFDTPNRYFTVIDAPGHRDFVKNMITGASQADAAVLVLGAKDGVMPQTKEHVFLIRTLGLKQLIVAVNKMDEVNYDQAAYNKAVEDIKKLLAGVGFKTDTVKYIPLSAWHGDNVAKKSDKMGWYTGETLIDALDKLEVPTKLTGKALRIPIQDVYTITGIGTVPVGRVETGVLKPGAKVVFMPSGKVGEVKDVEMHHEKVPQAEAGDNVGFNVRGINKGDVNRGEVCGDAANPPTVAEEFTAQIIVLQHPSVITKGYTPVFHAHTSHVACQITEIVKTLDPKTGEVKAEHPDFIKAGDAAVIKCKPTKPFVLEKAADYPPLGKFAIRDMGQTIAAGMVLDVVARKTA